MMKLFSKISTDVVAKKKCEESEECEIVTLTQLEAAKQRTVTRVEQIDEFKIELLLRPLDSSKDFQGISWEWIADLIKMPFGNLHAAILINGTIFLDWGQGSLVIPRPYNSHQDYPFRITIPFHQKDEVEAPCDVLEDEDDQVRRAEETKQGKIEALVKVILNYNKQYFYNPIVQNCQHFVVNAFEAMGCSVPKFEGMQKAIFSNFKKSREKISLFKNHQELDEYVLHYVIGKGNQTNPTHTMESLISQYSDFHSRERKSTDEQA